VNRRDVLEAVSAGLTDPHRLVDELLAATDAADARRRIAAELGLSDEQAQVVLDLQFSVLTAARRTALADELERERTPLGPPLHLRAELDASGRRATVSVDGVELVGRGRTAAKAVDDLASRVLEDVARRQHRPVVVEVDGVDGLAGVRWTPARSASAGGARRRLLSLGRGIPAALRHRGDPAAPELGEVRAHAGRASVGEVLPEELAGPLGHRRVDVAHRVPGRVLELGRAGDRVAEQQEALGATVEGNGQVTGV
jgi:hypothetical protein